MQIPTISYWNSNGRHQNLSTLLEEMIPATGEVGGGRANLKLEKFRKASNCYYDLYNNGLCNRVSEFLTVFKIASTAFKIRTQYGHEYSAALYEQVEVAMDNITMAAAVEQNVA